MGKIMRALGLMSGTSLDGIDVAMIDTDGAAEVVRGLSMTVPYEPEFRRALVQALADAHTIADRRDRPASLAQTERDLTDIHAAAVAAFLQTHGIAGSSLDVIGFHGQTVLHRPKAGLTVQLGSGQVLADVTPFGGVTMPQRAVYTFNEAIPLTLKYKFPLTITGTQLLDKLFLTPEGIAVLTSALELPEFAPDLLVKTDFGTIGIEVKVGLRKPVSTRPYVPAN